MDDLVCVLKRARVDDGLLEFFPMNKSAKLAHARTHARVHVDAKEARTRKRARSRMHVSPPR